MIATDLTISPSSASLTPCFTVLEVGRCFVIPIGDPGRIEAISVSDD